MLALGGRRLREGANRLCRARRRGRGLEPADIAAAGKGKSRPQQEGRSPKAAAHPNLAPSRKFCHSSHSYFSSVLISAQQLNLPDLKHFDARPATRLDPAADTNTPILQGLKNNSGSLDSPDHAP